ncbi:MULTISPECIES: YceI family protein [unclassified Flavobacterium]|uniref:YceI family protein n=1 Tax=unclassified Flavobacterium TaxID=196869 RepID=UPI00057EE08D|nr:MULTISPECIES: YceI family protein [unclassified Flavobacterium]KIA93984.1 lipid-binding protein [Flavobacterium sp. KMS]KIC02730.1 lipid-binding protein [Flavobacterium sp. JRM]MEA9415022.1 YceI family protein [Flavobacterium sp. PL02]OUL60919.1 lipid-binding protein [Flavobacterium sp. AJR]
MKNLKSIALALVVALSSVSINAQTKKVDVKTSTVKWVGKKVTGEHSGTVNLKDGALVFKGKKLAGGTFTVDMTSINATDLSGEYQGKLNGHLKADDFFGTEKFPTAKLVFKTIGAKATDVYTVTADLTIKGITKPVTFDITVNGNTATTAFKVDRTKYDIKYNSGNFFENLGDKTINDDFELTVALKF